MITDRFFKNELFTLLTQEQTHESFFEKEVHGRSSEPELPEEARQHLARWHMPEQGFRNYWYPVMLAKDLMLIRLFQQDTTYSVRAWRGLRFPVVCENSSGSSPVKSPVRNIWPPVVGLMDLTVRDVGTSVHMS
jgi:hypothetical protein